MNKLIQPLSTMVPIVDDDGKPTAQFARTLQRLAVSSNLSVTNGKIDVATIAAHMVMANKTAGSAAPTACTISDILDFLTTTRGSILFRGASGWQALAPGVANQVLQTNGPGADPTWATAGGGGGSYTLLEQHTAAGSATLDFTTGFSSTYDEYEFQFIQLVSAGGSNPWMRFSTNSGTSYDTSAIYDYASNFWGSSNFNANNGAENQAQVVLDNAGIGSAASLSGSGNLKLFNPASTSLYKTFNFQFAASGGDGHFYNTLGAGRYKSTTAVNAVRFMFSSGNITSGIIRLYGIAKT